MPPKRPREEGPKGTPTVTGRDRKRARTSQARQIQVQRAVGDGIPSATKEIGGSIDVEKFVESRAFEIEALENGMKSAKKANAQRVFQSLPRHLRRRAASHNLRRLPLRFRPKAKIEMSKTKAPERKRLRKLPYSKKLKLKGPRVLQLLRRQTRVRWLETHLWHAKRMKMVEYYGYKVAEAPTDKSFRPSYRAAKHGCILHDASYKTCIELRMKEDSLKRILQQMTDPFALSPCAARYINGLRECHTVLYEAGRYPRAMIGPVRIIWKPEDPADSSEIGRKLLIVCHPDSKINILVQIDMAATAINQSLLDENVLSVVNIPAYNIFEIMGPKSGQALARVLELAKGNFKEASDFLAYIAANGPNGIGSGTVAAMIVNDPRLNFPPEALSHLSRALVPVIPCTKLASYCNPNILSIWNAESRSKLRNPQYTKLEMDKLQSKNNANHVGHKKRMPTADDDTIPIMLVQTSIGNDLSGFALYVPERWGMAFWMSLSKACDRVGGLKQVRQQYAEAGQPHFPTDYVSTGTSDRLLEKEQAEKSIYWASLPSAIRTSYSTLQTKYPFGPDWQAIIPKTIPDRLLGCEDYNKAEVLSACAFRKILTSTAPSTHMPDLSLAFSQAIDPFKQMSPAQAQAFLHNAFVNVRMDVCGKGNLEDGAEIRMLTDDMHADLMSSIAKDDQMIFEKQYKPTGQIIGFVTSGGLSLSRGHCRGIGAVSVPLFLDSRRRDLKKNASMTASAKLKHNHTPLKTFVIYKNALQPFTRLATLTLID